LRGEGQGEGRFTTAVVLTLVALAAPFVNGSSLELQRGSFSLIRLLTCHFTHWSYEQLAWDAFAFLILGIACERRDRAAFHATLLASAIAIPIAVLLFAPNVTAYRGLSGIDSALFALLLTHGAKRSRMVLLCAVAFAAKIAFELTTGSAVFVSDMGADVVSVPIAHLAGALVPVILATPRKALLFAPLIFASCVALQTPPPDTRLPMAACSSIDIVGVWRSRHMTQLGPAWSELMFLRDCRFFGRDQVLWARFGESGNYAIEGKTIRFKSGKRERVVKFELDGEKLTIDDHGDRVTYTRASCGSSSPC
jgi:rhomboid family GlyGly-CTERM serine protease